MFSEEENERVAVNTVLLSEEAVGRQGQSKAHPVTLGVEQREKGVNGREWMLCWSLALFSSSDPGSVSCWVIETGPVLGSLSQMVPSSSRSPFAYVGWPCTVRACLP